MERNFQVTGDVIQAPIFAVNRPPAAPDTQPQPQAPATPTPPTPRDTILPRPDQPAHDGLITPGRG